MSDMFEDKVLNRNPLVFVAMSGGVDSSVAAALLKQRGYRVVGVFMKNWSEAIGDDTNCPWVKDQEDARKVAAKIGIPLYTLNFEEQYRNMVVEYFLREYQKGRTPNPDVMCNKEIKFGLFLEKSLRMGADLVATGHYVRLLRRTSAEKESYRLYRGKDPNKDQSYFLWTLTREKLRHCLFPVGDFAKPQIRKIALDLGLPTYNKPDSQGICFMGEFNVWDFLKKRIPAGKGPIVTVGNKNEPVGEHEGLPFYTIGQRKHIGVGGTGPYYVVEKDFTNNTLVVADNNHSEALYRQSFIAGEVNWIRGDEPSLPIKAEVQIRYRSGPASATIEPFESGLYRIVFDEVERAITEGQSAVFYQEEEMIGGGVIEKVE